MFAFLIGCEYLLAPPASTSLIDLVLLNRFSAACARKAVFSCFAFLTAFAYTTIRAIVTATIVVPKITATARPEGVRWSSRFIQTSAPATLEKHIFPGAQVPIAVTVGMQPRVLLSETEQSFVDLVLNTEQAKLPVVVGWVVVELALVDVVVLLSLVVEVAVVSVLVAAADETLESDVVVASVLEGAVVEAAADAMVVSAAVVFSAEVFAVVLSLAVVFSWVVESPFVVESPPVAVSEAAARLSFCRLLKSSRAFDDPS